MTLVSAADSSRPPPLAGIRVIEFTHMVAGPACGQVLADFGAEVTKVEPPQGDVTRRLGPMVGSLSALYASTNRGKRAVCLDLQLESDAKRARQLALEADVVIANVDRRMLERAHLDAASLRAENPRLIFVEVTGFGPGGPPGTDGLAQAAMGLMALSGARDGPGYRTGPSVVDISTGVWAALGTLAALENRRRTGLGDHVQTSLSDVCLYMQYSHLGMYAAAPAEVYRNGNHSLVSCTPVFAAADGRIILTLLNARHWRAFCEVLDEPGLIDAAEFASDALRSQNQSLLERRLAPVFASATRESWVSRMRAARVPCAPERGYGEVIDDVELRRRGMVFTLPVDEGEALQVRMPLEFETTARAPARAAPTMMQKEEQEDVQEAVHEVAQQKGDVTGVSRNG